MRNDRLMKHFRLVIDKGQKLTVHFEIFLDYTEILLKCMGDYFLI